MPFRIPPAAPPVRSKSAWTNSPTSPLSSPSSNPPPSASASTSSVFRLRVREAFVTRRRARLPVSPPRWSDGASRPTGCVVVDARGDARGAVLQRGVAHPRGGFPHLRPRLGRSGSPSVRRRRECGRHARDSRGYPLEVSGGRIRPRTSAERRQGGGGPSGDARRVRRRIVLRRLLGRRPRHPAGPRRDVPRRVH